MPHFDDYLRYSPLPLVNLETIAPPESGLSIAVPESCLKHFNKGSACRNHYQQIAQSSKNEEIVLCPFGFATYPFELKAARLAFTSIVPTPRLAGQKARETAKKHKANKIEVAKIEQSALALRMLEERISSLEDDFTARLSVALHEIRKLNRTVKQTAERLCMSENPSSPHSASPPLVQMWKTADMISSQFDIIELLANDSYATLPLGQAIELYRLFDKCVRIYTTGQFSKSVLLQPPPSNFRGLIQACDKTITIIPTVLIENALKYSIPNRAITIEFWSSRGNCHVEVTNYAKLNKPLTDFIFKKGTRLTFEKEGSGNGLYLARKIAKQHNASLDVSTTPVEQGVSKCTFTLIIPEIAHPR